MKLSLEIKIMARKLASIQRIINIEPIEGADAIMKATVLGWSVVIRKDEYKIGDLCVYVEIDSILPDRPEFEFMKARSSRVRTVKLRGQVSQGICFPLSILDNTNITLAEMVEDLDVTEAVGIIKWEPADPACLSGVSRGNFPSFIPKTDETRAQVLLGKLHKRKGEFCYITEKLDGSSMTVYVNLNSDIDFGVCGRNINFTQTQENTYWKVAIAEDMERKLRSLNRNIAVQGELVGEGIQKNKLKLKGHTIYIYSVFDIDKHEYLPFEEMVQILKQIDLKMVPIISTSWAIEDDMETLIKLSERKYTINPESEAEGIVIRTLDSKFSFKVINPRFLLKYEDA